MKPYNQKDYRSYFVKDHTLSIFKMSNAKDLIFPFYSLLLILSCSSKQQPLEGMWDISNDLYYVSDTTEMEDIFEPFPMERITVKTDSGLYKITKTDDSIIEIRRTHEIQFLEFSFESERNGILSQYKIDLKQNSTADLKFALNYDMIFSTYEEDNRSYILVRDRFKQKGESVDTVEYWLITPDVLVIFGDTVERIK